MRFIDLFCGIGGFRLALEARGHECVFSSEIDRHACDTYEANFGERPSGDITQVDAADIPEHDILCGGFPCQPFSMAGRRWQNMKEAKGEADERKDLFGNIVRIAAHHKPMLMLLENVPGLAQGKMRPHFEAICQAIDRLGYRLDVSKLTASDFGVPQKRTRLYFVAIRKDLDWSYHEPQPTREPCCLADVLEDNPDNKYDLSDAGLKGLEKGPPWNKVHNPEDKMSTIRSTYHKAGRQHPVRIPEKYYLSDKALKGLRAHREKHRAKGHGFGMKVLDVSRPSDTLQTTDVGKGRNLVAPTLPSNYHVRSGMHCLLDEGDKAEGEPAPTISAQYHKDGRACLVNEKYYLTDEEKEKVLANKEKWRKDPQKAYSVGLRSPEEKADVLAAGYNRLGRGGSLVKVGHVGESDGQGNRVYDSEGVAASQISGGGGLGAKTGLYLVGTIDPEGRREGKRADTQENRVYDSDGLGKTQDASTRNPTAQYMVRERIRRLTPRESFRLMGFPDEYMIVGSDTQAYKQAGNAVIPKMIWLVLGGISM